ncbi:hypothetical protein FRC04_009526 [Tulasnella sp. 424]|nr:hypothetical protein FRC04_009526 [Tulasnella sp. 424]KAG8974288.1 hypothetical protein FRC05_007712 [Tulasnella sp. 425]
MKAEATCEFLHDFILDLRLLEPHKKPSKNSDQKKAGSGVIDDEDDVELTMLIPPRVRNDTAGSSANTA